MTDVRINFLIAPAKKRALREVAARRDLTLTDLLLNIIDEKLSDPSFFTYRAQETTQNAQGALESGVREEAR